LSFFFKYLLLIIGAASGGSLLGALLTGWSENAFAMFLPIFAMSLLFTLVGASFLTAVGYFLRATLDGTWSGYFPIAIIALMAGPLMTLVFGPDVEIAFMGGVFAILTAGAWTILHRALRLSAMNYRV
jgi:hypothetical protein